MRIFILFKNLFKPRILFENLFKPRQCRLTVDMVTDFYLQPQSSALNVWLLTLSVLSATSKRGFEQPAASFLVCSLIFIKC
ncbi:hypothetical protein [Streptococcus pneumoniae]|uniref:hypothetical protein n=1 Tax=Streptococcus pneumoniae TaxID=1313 RepID=UPI0015DA644B|nr:hypothetical protein [Streptococcus pneumoniae]